MPYTALSQQPTARLPEGLAAALADVRGFEVRTRADDAHVGKVAEVLVDAAGAPPYLDVDLGGFFTAKHVLLPAGDVQIDAARRTAWVSGLTKDEVKHLPEYDGDPAGIRSGRAASAAVAGAGAVAGATAAGATAGDVRLTLSEEELAVGRQAVPAGEVAIRKTVETERVRRTVPVMREEVTIERRPAVGMDAATAQVEVTEDEIRIPIFAEEVVVEKRIVPKEAYIVRKRRVTETRTVEADLRRERLDVDQTAIDGSQAGAPQAGASQAGGSQAV